MTIDKSIKYAANTVVKEKSNRPLNKGGWVIGWNGEDYICTSKLFNSVSPKVKITNAGVYKIKEKEEEAKQ